MMCRWIAIDQSTLAHEKDPRFLVVARQAAVADIRIDHKSISRKHAVLYYQKCHHHDDDNDDNHDKDNHDYDYYSLLLCDLGTKKGIKVNGVDIFADSISASRSTSASTSRRSSKSSSSGWAKQQPTILDCIPMIRSNLEWRISSHLYHPMEPYP
jgi:hypothetical protein